MLPRSCHFSCTFTPFKDLFIFLSPPTSFLLGSCSTPLRTRLASVATQVGLSSELCKRRASYLFSCFERSASTLRKNLKSYSDCTLFGMSKSIRTCLSIPPLMGFCITLRSRSSARDFSPSYRRSYIMSLFFTLSQLAILSSAFTGTP